MPVPAYPSSGCRREVPTEAYIAPWNVETSGSSPNVPQVLPKA